MKLILATTLLMAWIPQDAAIDTVVVCPETFTSALQPWIKHRQQQGHTIQVVSNRLKPDEIRARIRGISKQGALKYILLVGDADHRAERDPRLRLVTTPSHYEQAKINIHWGSEPLIVTDNWYADLDDDSIPDVCIGRLPADTPRELTLLVQKVLTYEQRGIGRWCRKINLVAGVGGFGTVADSVLEMATKRFLTGGVPSSYVTKMTYGSWRSPYCPDPRRFHEATLSCFNEGCLFWVYIGHGHRWTLDRVRVPGGNHHILDVRDTPKLHCSDGLPIAIFLACYTGAFDDPHDCLAEEMLRRKQGPVAVLSGSRVTMPYAMAVLMDGMMTEYFKNQRETLGELVLHAKQRIAGDGKENQNRLMIDAIAAAISPARDRLDDERREHLFLFNLLGDPLMRMPYPKKVELESKYNVEAGSTFSVKGSSPVSGELTIELAVRRDALRFSAPARRRYVSTDEALNGLQDTYERALDQRWTSQTKQIQKGAFAQEISVPEQARGLCHVRAMVKGEATVAIGATDVFVGRPRSKQ